MTHDAHASLETPTLATIRKALLWTIVLGAAGTAGELLLIGHHESTAQVVPLTLLGAVILAGVIALAAPTSMVLRALQVLMLLCLGSGVLGVGLHYQGNEEFELEMYPSLSGMELLSKTLTGATPVLAPGAMSLIGAIGLALTYRHPLLRGHAPEHSEETRS